MPVDSEIFIDRVDGRREDQGGQREHGNLPGVIAGIADPVEDQHIGDDGDDSGRAVDIGHACKREQRQVESSVDCPVCCRFAWFDLVHELIEHAAHRPRIAANDIEIDRNDDAGPDRYAGADPDPLAAREFKPEQRDEESNERRDQRALDILPEQPPVELVCRQPLPRVWVCRLHGVVEGGFHRFGHGFFCRREIAEGPIAEPSPVVRSEVRTTMAMQQLRS